MRQLWIQMVLKAFGTSAGFWANVEKNYDLWNTEHSVERKSVRQFLPFKKSAN